MDKGHRGVDGAGHHAGNEISHEYATVQRSGLPNTTTKDS